MLTGSRTFERRRLHQQARSSSQHSCSSHSSPPRTASGDRGCARPAACQLPGRALSLHPQHLSAARSAPQTLVDVPTREALHRRRCVQAARRWSSACEIGTQKVQSRLAGTLGLTTRRTMRLRLWISVSSHGSLQGPLLKPQVCGEPSTFLYNRV